MSLKEAGDFGLFRREEVPAFVLLRSVNEVFTEYHKLRKTNQAKWYDLRLLFLERNR